MSETDRGPGQGEVVELPGAHVDGTDGIAEEDNAVPLWFNASFLGTIVFAIVYVIYYSLSGWSSVGQYEAEVAIAKEALKSQLAAIPEKDPYSGNPAAIAEGKQTFDSICAACHKADGSGLVGPSLVDNYWKYGGTDQDLYRSVMDGRPGGMPAWGAQLGADKVWKAIAYLRTLPQSDKPGLGAPGGVPIPGAAPAAAPGS